MSRLCSNVCVPITILPLVARSFSGVNARSFLSAEGILVRAPFSGAVPGRADSEVLGAAMESSIGGEVRRQPAGGSRSARDFLASGEHNARPPSVSFRFPGPLHLHHHVPSMQLGKQNRLCLQEIV